MTEPSYSIGYRLELDDGRVIEYSLEISENTLLSQVDISQPPPEWARLENGQCDKCQYGGGEYCPIAVRLAEPLKLFNGLSSHMRCLTTVTTRERNYVKRCDVQDALRSLFGLLMATSGCPAMRPFRYMARHHLPFASIEETVARITATYLIHQMFHQQGSNIITFDVWDIEALYQTMQSLNEGMIRRLKQAVDGDSALNAIVILNAYSTLIPIVVEDELRKMRHLFQ